MGDAERERRRRGEKKIKVVKKIDQHEEEREKDGEEVFAWVRNFFLCIRNRERKGVVKEREKSMNAAMETFSLVHT